MRNDLNFGIFGWIDRFSLLKTVSSSTALTFLSNRFYFMLNVILKGRDGCECSQNWRTQALR